MGAFGGGEHGGSKKSWWNGIRSYAMKSFLANILFILFSLPIISLPAARIALMKVMAKLYKSEECPVWYVFSKELMTGFHGKTLIGLLLLLPVFGSAFAYVMGYSTAGAVILASWLLIVFPVECFWTLTVALVDVPAAANLKNACILAQMYWGRSLLLMFSAGLAELLLLFLFPLSLFIMPLCCFSMLQMTICRITYLPVSSNLINIQD